jgi:hypothetical protein
MRVNAKNGPFHEPPNNISKSRNSWFSLSLEFLVFLLPEIREKTLNT